MTETLYGPGFFVERHSTVTASAAVVVPLIVELLQPRSVLDVGCGQGEWMDAFDVDVDVFGVDISAPEDEAFIRCDLTEPLDLGKRFDLALCLEVGEHLPALAADTLVDSLVRHAPAVVFSAAVPGQEGKGHINCQPHEYWHEKFAARGYEMSDPFRPRLAGDQRVSSWYRENTFLYAPEAGRFDFWRER
jgi:SAM-dependent methyltransferase